MHDQIDAIEETEELRFLDWLEAEMLRTEMELEEKRRNKEAKKSA